MISTADVLLVWGENVSGGQPARPPSAGVAMWAQVLGTEWVRWADTPPDAARTCRVALVNVFHTQDSTHCEQLRALNPNCYIIATVDPSLDIVLHTPVYAPLLRQLTFADLIGGRTEHDARVYGALLDKPSIWLPSPIGEMDYFAGFRATPKEDFIVTQDHPMLPNAVAHNVAALAKLQRATGLRVVYAAARFETRALADMAGLDAEFHDHIPFPDFVALTARARLCVDLYLRHSFHRHAVVCAAVGTPMVKSAWTCDTGHPDVDPLDPDAACDLAERLLNNRSYYRWAQEAGYATVERLYSFAASRQRFAAILRTLNERELA